MRLDDKSDFDVIILGSGIAGTILATILSRHGFSVLLIDGGTHPRFVIGESSVPATSQILTLLSREFDVPELNYLGLGSPERIREHITRSSGIKRLFGFAYHRPGAEHDANEAHQFGNKWRVENHFFRQDIDAYLLVRAIQHGAHAVQGVKIESVDVQDDGVAVVAGGRRYTGKFVADGTGFRSILADKFKLRGEPSTLYTKSRSIFTHMVDLARFEDVTESRMALPWSEGTLHHVFKGGWFWIIPFGNWEGAPNHLVSVGVTLDEDEWPEDSRLSPEREFERFVEMFPSVSRQFANAKTVRPWVRTKRLQYWSTKTVGNRWSLLSHAAGFIDPLFSRGLTNTMENIRSLARELLLALKDGDFTESRFLNIDKAQQMHVGYHDKIVAGAYSSFADFDVYNAWLRLWAVGLHDTESRLGSVIVMGPYSRFKPTENPISAEYEGPNYRALFEEMWGVMLRYRAKQLTVEETRRALWSALDSYEYEVPLLEGLKGQEWALKHPQCRDLYLGLPIRHEQWTKHMPDAHLG